MNNSFLRIWKRGNSINKDNSEVRNELLCVENGMSSSTNANLKFWQTMISLSIGRSQGDVIRWCKRLKPKSCQVAREAVNQLWYWHLGSQRHRRKKGPSLAPRFTRPDAKSKLPFRSIRNSTNWIKKPRRDQICNCIRLIQRCVRLWCLNGISEDGIQALSKVSNSLV